MQEILAADTTPRAVSIKTIVSEAGDHEVWILKAPQSNLTEKLSATERMLKSAQKEAHERKFRIISISELSGNLTGGAGSGLICVVEPITAIVPPK